MNNQFDELTKSMAQSVTRRAALKRFGVGLAGMALACFGLANVARADKVKVKTCATDADCSETGEVCCNGYCDGFAYGLIPSNPCACFSDRKGHRFTFCGSKLSLCDQNYYSCQTTCFSILHCGL